MPDGTDGEFRTLMHNLLSVMQTQLDNRTSLAEVLGLTGIQYTILTALAYLQNPDEAVAVVDVSRHLHVTASFITMEVNKLVDKGLVGKLPDDNDRRRVQLELTAAGWKLIDSIVPMQQPVNDAFFDRLSAKDFAALCRLMAILADNSERARATHLLLKATFTPPGQNRKRKSKGTVQTGTS
jgi:DNA-binding MarR family transcriptional regulator